MLVFPVRITEAVADCANTFNNRLTRAQDLLEHLLGVLARCEFEPLCSLRTQLRQLRVVRVDITSFVEYQLAY